METSAYLYFSILLSVLILFFSGWLLFRKKEGAFFIRPSVLFIGVLYVIYLLPAQIFNRQVKMMSPFIDISSFLLAVVLFISLLGAYFLYKKIDSPLIEIWPLVKSEKFKTRLFVFFLALLIIFLGLYFSQNSFRNTGLYAIFCDPSHYVILREKSLKLLGIPWLTYVYLIGFSCLCPLLCAYYVDKVFSVNSKKTRMLLLIGGIPLLLFLLFYMLITGARVGVLNCSLAVLGVLWFRLSWKKFIFSSIATIAGAMAVSALIGMAWANRSESGPSDVLFCTYFSGGVDHQQMLEGEMQLLPSSETTQQNVVGFSSYLEGIVFRIFMIPAAISGWYIEEGIHEGMRPQYLYTPEGRKISNTFAIKYVKRVYGEGYQVTPSVTTPVAFVFVNFVYFGFWSILISILGILSLDTIFLVAKKMDRNFVTPLLGMCLYYVFIFAQTGFFTVVFSHGYSLLAGAILVCYVVFRWLLNSKKVS